MNFYRNGNRVAVAYDLTDDGIQAVAIEQLPDGTFNVLSNPIIDLLTGQVYDTPEDYALARQLASAARKSETV